MTAKDIISLTPSPEKLLPIKSVDAETPLLDVLPRLLDAPGRLLGVSSEEKMLGVIDEISMLEGLGHLIAERDDSSVITVECMPEHYSASAIAHAVEDADIHLVDLISYPSDRGRLRVMLRVRSLDPTPVIGSLERYGYNVVEATQSENAVTDTLAERLASLQALMNV